MPVLVYWDSEGTNLGECHRFPPRAATVLRAGAEGRVRRDGPARGRRLAADRPGRLVRGIPAPAATAARAPPSSARGGDVGPAGI